MNVKRLVDMLIDRNYTEIIALGVTKSELLRKHASALDGMASCKLPVAMNDENVAALTMLRLYAKVEISPRNCDIVLKLLSKCGEAKAALNMEGCLLRQIELRSGLSLQPLVQ